MWGAPFRNVREMRTLQMEQAGCLRRQRTQRRENTEGHITSVRLRAEGRAWVDRKGWFRVTPIK